MIGAYGLGKSNLTRSFLSIIMQFSCVHGIVTSTSTSICWDVSSIWFWKSRHISCTRSSSSSTVTNLAFGLRMVAAPAHLNLLVVLEAPESSDSPTGIEDLESLNAEHRMCNICQEHGADTER